MAPLGLLALGFAPGLFWFWLIYQRGRYLPAPMALVVRAFLFGALLVVPVAAVEFALTGFGAIDSFQADLSLSVIIYAAFIVAGLTEELSKFLVVRYALYNSPYFSQPLDGLIFGSAAALGFASLENVGYMVQFGPAVMLVRGPVSTLAHVLFSAPWAFALGRQKRMGRSGTALVWISLAGAMALHGLFNFLLFSQDVRALGALALFLGGIGGFLHLLRRAEREAAARRPVAAVLLRCPTCDERAAVAASYCTRCGALLWAGREPLQKACSLCDGTVRGEFSFCPWCGARLDRRSVWRRTVAYGASRRGIE